MRTAFCVSLAALIILVTGCGSIGARWSGRREAYAGVKLNLETIRNYKIEGELISAVDIPFSAIADTLLLPYDLSGDGTNKPAAEPVAAVEIPAPANP